jgi:hypothetical protein
MTRIPTIAGAAFLALGFFAIPASANPTSIQQTGGTAEFCIYEGVNICPEPPIKNIVLCITTSMLAGSECPPFNGAQKEPGLTTKQVTPPPGAVLTTRQGRTSWPR